MIMPVMVSSMVAEQHFEARGTDVLLVTMPKCGTTWIKALLYAAARRTDDTSSILRQLASHNSHQLVPFLEAQVYTKDQIPDLSSLPAPRLFASHIPAESLPPSVVASGCKVVYLCRNPKDCFVSLWHFMSKFTPRDIDEAHD
uniref:Sulfotransferase n=1 Tax=Triticum urartu TaxID=4572 RepID=A0A8R7QSX6_TRIUA